MADWYVSSAAYATYTAFQINHAYIIGNIIVPTAPASGSKQVMRCTTAGTSAGSEPTWPTFNNGTVTSGTATFTNVTGQSTYFWTAAAGDLATLVSTQGTNRTAVGDRVFLSSDHAETTSSGFYANLAGSGYGVILFLCVNRAGSTPPVAADVTTGASITTGSVSYLTAYESYWDGISFVSTGNLTIGTNSTSKTMYLKNCQIYLNSGGSASITIQGGAIWDNTTVKFGNAAQQISNIGTLTWISTPSAIVGATIPTNLMLQGNAQTGFTTCRGVDLSATTNTLVKQAFSGPKVLFDSCKIASGVSRFDNTSSQNNSSEVTLINCYDGTNIISEQYATNGTISTEFTITLSSGATDDVGTYSHKMVSNTNIDKFVYPLAGFWMDMNYTTIGSPKTASVEIISSTTLNNDEIALFLEYEGTAGTSVTSFADSLVATVLTTPAAVTTSSATWNSSPATPQKQVLQVTFTPQVAGRVRGQVRLGKASTTVYYNPQMTIS